jgi:hypothetical protein
MLAPSNAQQSRKHVICVSWVPSLAATRNIMLTKAGYEVTNLLGRSELRKISQPADLLILAHSVPPEEKQRAIGLFHQVCHNPVLSLLDHHQRKLPEADFGIEASSPEDFIAAVESIFGG